MSKIALNIMYSPFRYVKKMDRIELLKDNGTNNNPNTRP